MIWQVPHLADKLVDDDGSDYEERSGSHSDEEQEPKKKSRKQRKVRRIVLRSGHGLEYFIRREKELLKEIREKKIKKTRKKNPKLIKKLDQSLQTQLSLGGCWQKEHVEKIAWLKAAKGDMHTIEANGEGTHDLRFNSESLLLQEFLPAGGAST